MVFSYSYFILFLFLDVCGVFCYFQHFSLGSVQLFRGFCRNLVRMQILREQDSIWLGQDLLRNELIIFWCASHHLNCPDDRLQSPSHTLFLFALSNICHFWLFFNIFLFWSVICAVKTSPVLELWLTYFFPALALLYPGAAGIMKLGYSR